MWHYTVKPGDCLWTIAQQYGETLATVEEDNPQFSPNWDLIYSGQGVAIGGTQISADITTDPNPLRGIDGLQWQRVDEGQDIAGHGPLYPVAAGTIVSVFSSGWPDGIYILEKLDVPVDGHDYVYYAESIAPSVSVGDSVTTSTPLGTLNGEAEIGWGTSVPSQTYAAATTGYSEGEVTPAGTSFSLYLKSLVNNTRHSNPDKGTGPLSVNQGPGPSSIDGIMNTGVIYDFLVKHGLNHNAAAGVVGNIGQESMGNPGSVGDGGCGLIGWTPCSVPVGDLYAQMDDILSYIAGDGSIADINAHAVTPESAADWFMTEYERCNPTFCNSGHRESVAAAVASAE